MGIALYRKYRPKSLDDVVGQDHIVKSLQKSISSGTISHAYLLTGPRGVGKTSIARILAHELNNLSYEDSSMHLDIIEIDAASNRRIDEIRDLRDKVHIAPTSAKYKVYIIDEVHMLTREAFNALLKTLEEPPAHVIFILATTEAHKVPDTIISRTQRYNFKPITSGDTVAHLAKIAKKEKILIDEKALLLLAEHAAGSFRDSINLLDQLAGGKESVTYEEVSRMLGLPQKYLIDDMLGALERKSPKEILLSIDAVKTEGAQAVGVARHLLTELRTQIADGNLKPASDLINLLDGLSRVGTSAQANLQLELALLRYVSTNIQTEQLQVAPTVEPSKNTKMVQDINNTLNINKLYDTPNRTIENSQTDVQPDIMHDEQDKIAAADLAYWNDLLDRVKTKHNTLYSMLRIARPKLTKDTLTLTFNFPFHQKKVAQTTNLKFISDSITEILGRPITVTCLINKSYNESKNTNISHKNELNSHLTDVSNFFNGAELLE